MICCTRSGSASASAGRFRGAHLEPASRCRSAAGPNSRATSLPARRGRPVPAEISIAPASSFERSSRSVVSLVRRATCSRIVRTNSARASGSGSSSSSSSTNPPSEKIGVRSSCEALAMNCLRALSSSARRRCMSLKVRASWPSSSEESTGIGAKSPRATLWAAAIEAAEAPRDRPRGPEPGQQREGQRDRAGDHDLALDQRHVVGHLAERLREDRDPDRVLGGQRDRDLGAARARDHARSRRGSGRRSPCAATS